MEDDNNLGMQRTRTPVRSSDRTVRVRVRESFTELKQSQESGELSKHLLRYIIGYGRIPTFGQVRVRVRYF